ncbi:hypothetical protein ACFLXA_00975 [Chloroflexota bacterium]
MWNLIGKVAFIAGLLFAIVGGIWGGESIPENDGVVFVLLLCGIFIGLLNITAKEVPIVLMSTVALVVMALWGDSSASTPIAHLSRAVWENMVGIIACLAILMVPAAVIISVRAIISTADRD